MQTRIVNMTGRKLTDRERIDLREAFITHYGDCTFWDVDQYGSYRYGKGIDSFPRIVDMFVTDMQRERELEYDDRIVFIVSETLSLYDLHLAFKTLMHSWLRVEPIFVISYPYLSAIDGMMPHYTYQAVKFDSVMPSNNFLQAVDSSESVKTALGAKDAESTSLEESTKADIDKQWRKRLLEHMRGQEDSKPSIGLPGRRGVL